MSPALSDGDVIIVDTLSMKFLPPRRGEILVFRNPHKYKDGDSIQVDVKRVVGLPGETAHVLEEKVVVTRACSADSLPSAPQFSNEGTTDGSCQKTYPSGTLLGGGSFPEFGNGQRFEMFLGPLDYFVLGDNRQISEDSRRFGAVQPENFVGRATLRIFPISQFTVLPFSTSRAFMEGVQ